MHLPWALSIAVHADVPAAIPSAQAAVNAANFNVARTGVQLDVAAASEIGLDGPAASASKQWSRYRISVNAAAAGFQAGVAPQVARSNAA